MDQSVPTLQDFMVAGITHRDAPVSVRELFSLNDEQKTALMEKARDMGVESLIVVSTCNRTELIARKASAEQLTKLLVDFSDASNSHFNQHGFIVTGHEAIVHLFSVSTGLNSQILGDLQIIKQIKEAYQFANQQEMVDGVMHRMMQHVFRAHKRSRNETDLAQGAATTAYAAVQFARQKLGNLTNRSILLVGTGKIGKVTCRNLISLGATHLTLVNRNRDRAEFLADRYELEVSDIENLPQAIASADLVIVATGAEQPIIRREHLAIAENSPLKKRKVMLDLSVPRNIDPKIGELDFVEIANMDLFEDVTDEVYQKRRENVPLVEEIILDEIGVYEQWLSEQRVVPTIKALTKKFDNIRKDELDFFKNKISEGDLDKVENLTRRIVNKIAAHSIDHLKDNHTSNQVDQLVRNMFKLEAESNN